MYLCIYIYTHIHTYTYIYIYKCCEVSIWAKFGVLKGYYLGQVCFRTIKIGVSGDFVLLSYHFVFFVVPNYLAVF